jgi:arylsulfatase A-like enzyme
VAVTPVNPPEPDGGVVLWGSPVVWEPAAKRFNVMILLEDALRADRMSVYGYERETTPFKRKLFAGGVRFEYCIAPATNTRFSCPSIMTGLRPLATGVYGRWDPRVRLSEDYLTLAEVLGDRGWATAAFLQNGNAGPDVGLDQGFEQIVEHIPGPAQAVYAGDVLAWLERVRERNFFGYLPVIDPHTPYEKPYQVTGWLDELIAEAGGPRWTDPAWVSEAKRALYDGEVANNDAALERLVVALEKMDLLDDTLLVFIADHGEHLGERGLWNHRPPSYVQVVRVPMLLRLPSGRHPYLVIDEPVQLVDLLPTVLDLVGLDGAALPLHGRSLVPLIDALGRKGDAECAAVQDAVSYSSADDRRVLGSLFWKEWHALYSQGVEPTLFNLKLDPDEVHGQRPEPSLEQVLLRVAEELHRLDDEVRVRIGPGSAPSSYVDLRTLENLEALGYLDD